MQLCPPSQHNCHLTVIAAHVKPCIACHHQSLPTRRHWLARPAAVTVVCSSRAEQPRVGTRHPCTARGMSSQESYSIWLMPGGGCAQTLQREITEQAQEHGVASFEPHVTLLGGITRSKDDVLAILNGIASWLKPLRVNFLDVTTGDKFHQCVYILCANEAALQAAQSAACKAFDLPPQPYMPHLSLLYADLDAAARMQAARRAVQRLYGEGSNYETLLRDSGFDVAALSVWYTPAEDKSLASWCKVADVPLS